MGAESRFVRLYGLQVEDAARYREYRAGMTPILQRHGGRFGYDFVVAETLRSETAEPINRVFTLVFPTREASRALFEDPEYLRVRRAFFEPAVGAVTVLAEFES